MPDPTHIDETSQSSFPAELLGRFLSQNPSTSQRIQTIEAVLSSPASSVFRDQIGKWVLQFLPVEHLVPELYAKWRPLVYDAMLFMFAHLSTPRLAPKLVEQIELPPDSTPELRLLRLISKVPGLQKLGQVLARNRNLAPSFRRALTELENGISDVNRDEIRAIILRQLGSKVDRYKVEIKSKPFFEASVSAVMRFTWENPESRKRECGVLKVMKPYIQECFAEDMQLLARLAKHLGSKHREYGFAEHVLPETFQDIRRLLRHEVQFSREQKTLVEAQRLYRSVRSVRIPQVIRPLCTPTITALTEEQGKKVTTATSRLPVARRHRVAEQIVHNLLAIPLFASTGNVMFHADPHAGNLLYDKKTGELVILDWALTEHLSHDQRRHLAMLFLMIFLRDPLGTSYEVQALRHTRGRHGRREARIIGECVTHFMAELPLTHVPGALDAMNLLERIAWAGVRLPTPLVMLRKVLFTLDGILHDIAGAGFRMEVVLARYLAKNWITKWPSVGAPLSLSDWLLVQCSTLFYPSRFLMQGAQSVAQGSRSVLPS